jgi:purine-nucleoside phosphorylase
VSRRESRATSFCDDGQVTDDPYAAAAVAAERLVARLGGAPDVAVVLGSGWAPAVEAIGPAVQVVSMTDIPGFPAPTVAGHAGTITSIDVAGTQVVVMAGRAHLYEGHAPSTVVHGVRAAVLAGCRVVVLTNAAGSLRPDWPVGGPVLIADHLNLTGASPMVGPALPDGVPARFVDLSDTYSKRLRSIALEIDASLQQGVYAALLGGSYETPAEIRALRTLGADLVGMSTALEAIAAVHLGAEVLGISLVTNLAAGLSTEALDHREVLAAGAGAAADVGRLLRGFVERV